MPPRGCNEIRALGIAEAPVMLPAGDDLEPADTNDCLGATRLPWEARDVRGIIALFAITACFPHDAKHRRIAKISEAGAIASGIALQFVANHNACMERRAGTLVQPCEDGHLDSVGVVLIFAGLLGFAATTMSGMEHGPKVEVETPFEQTVAIPQAFCASLYAGDHLQAAASLTTYARSMGATTRADTLDALHAFLARQPCVVLEETELDRGRRFVISVPTRATRFAVDATSAPFVVLLAR